MVPALLRLSKAPVVVYSYALVVCILRPRETMGLKVSLKCKIKRLRFIAAGEDLVTYCTLAKGPD